MSATVTWCLAAMRQASQASASTSVRSPSRGSIENGEASVAASRKIRIRRRGFDSRSASATDIAFSSWRGTAECAAAGALRRRRRFDRGRGVAALSRWSLPAASFRSCYCPSPCGPAARARGLGQRRVPAARLADRVQKLLASRVRLTSARLNLFARDRTT